MSTDTVGLRALLYARHALILYGQNSRAKAIALFERLLALDPTDKDRNGLWLAAAKAGTIQIDGDTFKISTKTENSTSNFSVVIANWRDWNE
jgi:tetratricopeptide (TPR) repeat protein